MAAYGINQLPLDLRDEATNPRTEFHALRVELDGRSKRATALRILELIPLHVALQIAQRIAKRSAARRPLSVCAKLRRRSCGRQLQRGLRIGRRQFVLRRWRGRRVWLRLGLLPGGGIGCRALPARGFVLHLLDAVARVAP